MKIGYIACSTGIRDVLCYSMDILFLFYRKDLVTLKRESVFL